jgi:two-component system cell cycle sensor histidine kinase/response regulator CckA
MQDGANETRGTWLRPLPLQGPGDARLGTTVNVLSLSFVVAIGVFALALAFLPLPRTAVYIPLTAVAIFLAANALARLGSARLAAHVLVAGMWLSTTWAVAVTGSANSPALGAYLLLILAAAFLIGQRAAVWAAGVSAACVLLLAHLEAQGRLPAAIPQTPWITISTMLTLIAATAALLWDALGRIGSAVSRAERSEARMRGLIDQASDAIIVLDSAGNVCEASARAAEMSGYAREEITRMRVSEFLAGEELDDAHVLLRDLRPGAVLMRERRLRRKDGTWLPVENSVARLTDGRVQCIVRDVSARKLAEAMQDRLRVALDEAGEAITLFDSAQRLLYANRAARRLYGSDDALRPGMHVDEVIVVAPQREFWDRARHELALGKSYSGRLEYVRPNGARAVHHVALAVVREDGEPGGFVSIAREITREVELEESAQLTRRLEAVGQLAGGLAHDFNNLLTVILGSAEAIRMRKESADVEEIIEAGQRAAALTTKLLSFSRTQAIRLAHVDLSRVVADASAMLRRLVRENVSLELRLASEPVWVMADANQVTQVLVNLAANARDAMPEGGTLELATGELALTRATRPERVRVPDGDYAVLSARDTGEGMSPDVIDHVFEPFFTTKQPGSNTGLGLASVHEIVKQAGGAIEVKSELGKGTQLRIFLPRAPAPAGALEKPAASPERAQQAASRILVVEDEALLRGLVIRSLEARGHRVVSARTGKEALELGLAEPPDLLVTDVVLPGLDGSRLTEQLREHHPLLRVLFMSGYEPDVIGGAASDGRTRFLAKPFAISKLVERVDELLAQRQQSSQRP